MVIRPGPAEFASGSDLKLVFPGRRLAFQLPRSIATAIRYSRPAVQWIESWAVSRDR